MFVSFDETSDPFATGRIGITWTVQFYPALDNPHYCALSFSVTQKLLAASIIMMYRLKKCFADPLQIANSAPRLLQSLAPGRSAITNESRNLLKIFNSIFVCLTAAFYLQAAQLPVDLGSAGAFSVLASSTVTNTGPSSITGDVGLSPGTAVTGFPPGQVIGATHAADGPAGLAQGALTTAYIDAAGRAIPAIVAGDLGGQTLPPGLYKSTSSLGITGILRLDGQGDPNSVFIFQIASALTTASVSQVILQGGAQAANIFWQVGSSATLGTNSIFNGSILAQASVSLTTGATLTGRALARTGAVTLDTNTIVNPGPPTTIAGPRPLTVTCPLNAAQSGTAYNSALVATGGTPPYTFSITGLLPPGLVLNTSTGSVTGSPAAASGAYAFSANAQDSAGGRVTNGSCSIVAALTPPPPTPAPSSLNLVLIGFAVTALYRSRERLLRLFKST